MYSGIIQAKVSVLKILASDSFNSLTFRIPKNLKKGLRIGSSIALNGSCLTVTKISFLDISVDISQHTQKITNLNKLSLRQELNFERSLKIGSENGGHNLYGHIMGTAAVIQEIVSPMFQLGLQLPPQYLQYVCLKGFLGVNGVSLTIAEIHHNKNQIFFNLIPETMRQTNLQALQVRDDVNIELDPSTMTIVDCINRNLYKKRSK